VVWELTLACNLRCSHCGSRAGKRRPQELTTLEALEVVDHLARLGTRELSIIGGEAYLRSDWTQVVAAASGHGMYVAMQSGARALTEQRLKAGARAGLQGLGVSLDGLRDLHDRIRGVRGSFEGALRALERANSLGLRTSVNTVIGPETIADLPGILEQLIAVGAKHWQVQLTVPMGNAADHPELILQPYQLLELMPLLAELYHEGRRRGVLMIPGNNIGYFGPYEHLWRTGSSDRKHWTGCSAGQTGMGIESDGTVKGCPSLATNAFGAGNIRDLSLEQLWRRSRQSGGLRPAKNLWGFCGGCYYREVCVGGCTWTSHSLLGVAGNNPYCHHRALTLANRGRRERVVQVEDADAASFAIGRFELVEENFDGTHGELAKTPPAVAQAPLRVIRHTVGSEDPHNGEGRIAQRLRMCQSCASFVLEHETHCPFCQVDLGLLERRHDVEREYRQQLIDEVHLVAVRTSLERYHAMDLEVSDEEIDDWLGLSRSRATRPGVTDAPYARIRELYQRLEPPSLAHLLDIGSAHGRIGLYGALLFGISVTGLEIDHDRVRQAQRAQVEFRLDDVNFRIGNGLVADWPPAWCICLINARFTRPELAALSKRIRAAVRIAPSLVAATDATAAWLASEAWLRECTVLDDAKTPSHTVRLFRST
jgi:Y-X(10)_GDL-associated radical SAM protein